MSVKPCSEPRKTDSRLQTPAMEECAETHRDEGILRVAQLEQNPCNRASCTLEMGPLNHTSPPCVSGSYTTYFFLYFSPIRVHTWKTKGAGWQLFFSHSDRGCRVHRHLFLIPPIWTCPCVPGLLEIASWLRTCLAPARDRGSIAMGTELWSGQWGWWRWSRVIKASWDEAGRVHWCTVGSYPPSF